MTPGFYYIGELVGDTQARLLSAQPVDANRAHSQLEKLREAEKILPEGMRRRLFCIDLQEVMPVAGSAE